MTDRTLYWLCAIAVAFSFGVLLERHNATPVVSLRAPVNPCIVDYEQDPR